MALKHTFQSRLDSRSIKTCGKSVSCYSYEVAKKVMGEMVVVSGASVKPSHTRKIRTLSLSPATETQQAEGEVSTVQTLLLLLRDCYQMPASPCLKIHV